MRTRSEEHTSELQSPCNLVCRLLLEKKNKIVLKGSRILAIVGKFVSARMSHHVRIHRIWSFFFFNDTATTEIYTLSLHDALPICCSTMTRSAVFRCSRCSRAWILRSEEHTSELQSPCNLVCRLLLEKKKHTLLHDEYEVLRGLTPGRTMPAHDHKSGICSGRHRAEWRGARWFM